MDLNGFWRFDLVRGYSPDPTRGACLLMAVSWLVEGKRSDRPKCVCPLLAQFGRHANDILNQSDRQRLKAFIIRLADSRDASVVERRARVIVGSLMYGMLQGYRALAPERLGIYFVWARAILFLRLGFFRGAIDVALAAFGRALSGITGRSPRISHKRFPRDLR